MSPDKALSELKEYPSQLVDLAHSANRVTFFDGSPWSSLVEDVAHKWELTKPQADEACKKLFGLVDGEVIVK